MAQAPDTNDVFDGIRDKATSLLHSALKRLASKGVSRTGQDLHAEQHQAVLSVLFQVAYALGLNGQTIDAYFNLQEELQGCTGLPALKARYIDLVTKLTQLHNELAHMQLPRLDELGISLGQALQRAFQVYARKQLGQGRFQYDHENPRLNDSQLFKLCQDAGLLEPQGTLPTANLHVIMAAHKPPGSSVMRLDFKTFMKLLARVASEVLLDVYVPVAALGLATRPRPLLKILQNQAKVDLTKHWNLPCSSQPISDETLRLLNSMPAEVPIDGDADPALRPETMTKSAAPGSKDGDKAVEVSSSVLTQLMERMDTLQAEVSVLNEKHRIAEHRGNVAQDQAMQMQTMLMDMAAREKDRFRGVRGDMERFMVDLTQLQKQVGSLTDRVKTLEESLEEQMDGQHASLQRLQERMAVISRKVDQVATDKLDVSLFGDLQASLETLNRDKASTESRLTQLEAAAGKLHTSSKSGAGAGDGGADQVVPKKFSEQMAVFQAETAGQLAVQRETTKNLGAQLATVQADVAGHHASIQEAMQQIQQQLESLGHRTKEYIKQDAFDEFTTKIKDELAAREAHQGATELAFQHIVVQIQQLSQQLGSGARHPGPINTGGEINRQLPMMVPEEDEGEVVEQDGDDQEYRDDFEGEAGAELQPDTPLTADAPAVSDLQPDQQQAPQAPKEKRKKKKKQEVVEEEPLDFSAMVCVDGEWYEGGGVVHGLKAALEVYVEDYDPDAEALTADRLKDCPGEDVSASDWDSDEAEEGDDDEQQGEDGETEQQPQYVQYAPVQRTRKVLVAPVVVAADGGAGEEGDDDLARDAQPAGDQQADLGEQHDAEGSGQHPGGDDQQPQEAEPVAYREAKAPREGKRRVAAGTRPGGLSADPAIQHVLQGMLNDFARQMGMEIRLDQLSGAELEAAERLAISLLGDRAPEVLAAATRKAVIEKGVGSEEATACGKELVVAALTGSEPEADVAVRLASGILGPGHVLTQTAAASAIASRSTSSFLSRPPEFNTRPGSARPGVDIPDGGGTGEGYLDSPMAVVHEEEEQAVDEAVAASDELIHAAVKKARDALIEHGHASQEAGTAVQELFDLIQDAAAEGSELSQALQQMIESAMLGESEASAAADRAARHLATCVFAGGTNRHNMSRLHDMMSLIYGDDSAESLATAAAARLTDATLGATTAEETQAHLAREARVHASGSSVMAAGMAQVAVQTHGAESEEAAAAAKHVMRVAFSEAEANRSDAAAHHSRLNSRVITALASAAKSRALSRAMSRAPSAVSRHAGVYSPEESVYDEASQDVPMGQTQQLEEDHLQPADSVFARAVPADLDDEENTQPHAEPVPHVEPQGTGQGNERSDERTTAAPPARKGVRLQVADGDDADDKPSRSQGQRELLHRQRSRRVYRMDDDGLGSIDPEVMVRLPAEVQQLAHAVNALIDITRETRAAQKDQMQAVKSSNTVYSLSAAMQEQAENVGRQAAKLTMLEAAVLKVAKEMDTLKNSMQQQAEERRPLITVGAPAMPPMNRYSSFRAPSAMAGMGSSSGYARAAHAIHMEPERQMQGGWDMPPGGPREMDRYGMQYAGPPPQVPPMHMAPQQYEVPYGAAPADPYQYQYQRAPSAQVAAYPVPAPALRPPSAMPAVAERQAALEEDVLKHASYLSSRQGEAIANAAAALSRSAAGPPSVNGLSSGAAPSAFLNSDPGQIQFESPPGSTYLPGLQQQPRPLSNTGAWPGQQRLGPQPPADPNPYQRQSVSGSSLGWPDAPNSLLGGPRSSSGGGRSVYPEQMPGAAPNTPSTPPGPRPVSARFSRPIPMLPGASPLVSPSGGTEAWGRSAMTGPGSSSGAGGAPRVGALTADPVDDPRKLRTSQPGQLQGGTWQSPSVNPKQDALPPAAPAQPSVALAAVAYGASAMQHSDLRFANGRYRKL